MRKDDTIIMTRREVAKCDLATLKIVRDKLFAAYVNGAQGRIHRLVGEFIVDDLDAIIEVKQNEV